MIVDTGPLVMLLTERHDSRYQKVKAAFDVFRGELITTLPCLTETMYLVDKWHLQSALWNWFLEGSIKLYDLTHQDMIRMEQLMEKYQDMPMDFADASVVAVAEATGSNKILAIDSDFLIYRFRDRIQFELIPNDD